MINDFNNGAEGWTDWNVLLDEKGGPNHVQNFCYAPIHADTKTGELSYMNSYYYIGHFSKFIRPGARRIISSSTTDELLTTAFLKQTEKLPLSFSIFPIKRRLLTSGWVVKPQEPAARPIPLLHW